MKAVAEVHAVWRSDQAVLKEHVGAAVRIEGELELTVVWAV